MARRVALVLLGDIMLGRVVDESLTALPERASAVWGDTLPLLQGGMAAAAAGEMQVVAGNLECAVTAEEHLAPKMVNFKLSPTNIGALRMACLDFASLANNHILDYLEAGMAETTATLRSAGIAFAGVGTAAEASALALLERGGLRLAFLSYSNHYAEWAASSSTPGINFIDPENYDVAAVQREVAAARKAGADLVTVFIHWGPNWQWHPSKAIQQLGHDFIDAGADLVFGTSSHHVQGIQIYRERPIIYGAGGWIDDYRLDEKYRNDLGFLYCAHVADGRVEQLELVPTRILHSFLPRHQRPPYLSEVRLAQGEDRAWLAGTLRKLCTAFGTRVEEGREGRLLIPCRQPQQQVQALQQQQQADSSEL